MDRFTGMAFVGASLLLAAGCAKSEHTGQFQSYKSLAAKDAESAATVEADAALVASTKNATTAPDSGTPATNENNADVITPVSALAPVNVVDGTSMAAVLKVFPSSTSRPGVPETTLPASPPAEPVAAAPKPMGIQLLVPNRDFKTEGPDHAIRASYDDLDLLKVLNMEPVPEDAVKHFPPWLKALDGKRVRLRGFMYPTFQATGIDQFVLARDNQICCFGRNPKVYDLVSVQMRDNVTTDYIQNRPFDVVGTFRIDLIAEGGKPMGLYWLEDSIVINK